MDRALTMRQDDVDGIGMYFIDLNCEIMRLSRPNTKRLNVISDFKLPVAGIIKRTEKAVFLQLVTDQPDAK